MAQITVRAIAAKGFDPKAIRAEIRKALDKEGREDRRLFERTTATWRNRPRFETTVREGAGEMAVRTIPAGPHAAQFGYVDQGTDPHVIRPRRARVLSFRTGYRAKTRPGVIGSSGGGASGATAHARQVQHPGTQARRFSPEIERQRRGPFRTLVRTAIAQGVRRG